MSEAPSKSESLCTENTSDDLPPVMQSSNNISQERLDITYGGGGVTTSDADNNQMYPSKRRKIHFIDSSSENFIELNVNSEDQIDTDDSCPVSQINEMEENVDSEKKNYFIDNVPADMEFDVVDEFESNDNDGGDSDSYISLDELDELLEAGLVNGKCLENPEIDEKEKIILKVRGRDHFDVLPEGWIEVTHNSGMPLYLHKATRVCSASKPYFLGPGSIRKHEIPISAIPCLHYLKELEKEKEEAKAKENTENGNEQFPSAKLKSVKDTNESKSSGNEQVPTAKLKNLKGTKESRSLGNGQFPSAKLESVKDTKESRSLDPIAVREYCARRFEFQTIKIKRFKTWCGRRTYQKSLKRKQRPSLPDSTKLITCPLPPATDKNNPGGNNTKREFVMNPSGKSPVCILHEYVQHSLRNQPKYVFKELENASTPYGAVVLINEMEYGSGYGSSKKQAKSEAAKAALDVLIPNMKMFSEVVEEQQDLEFFDQVRIEDPRVSELSVKAGQPYPYQILLECLKRNYGMGDTEVCIEMKNLKHQKNEFQMSVGKHEVSVICKNKRDGKHRASQAILKRLHPHITSWGSLLRMYGKGSFKTLKEKKEEEQRITELQSQACANKPNMSILNKLKEEMLKYREKARRKRPIGKLINEKMDLSKPDSNLKNVEL